jgi:hypothetical protein
MSIIWLNSVYIIVQDWIYNGYLFYPFILLTVCNNIYQVFAHIFTGTKFLGFKHIVPHGSSDQQTLTVFTVSNIFDILGWMTIYIAYGYANPFYSMLAAVHYGSGLVAIFFNHTFQKYYIGTPYKIHKEQDSFGYTYWKIFRVVFVFTDAISRGWATYHIVGSF